MAEFGVKLQNARVVYEVAGAGTSLLEGAQKVYAAGLQWSQEERTAHRLWLLVG